MSISYRKNIPRGTLRVIDYVIPTGYVKNAYYNGLGRYVCQLQRMTIKFCKSKGSSKGVREFIETELIDFARNNPGVAVYLKPRRHRSPVLVTEYLNGERHWMSMFGFTKTEVVLWLDFMRTRVAELMLSRSGYPLCQFLSESYTPHPSFQGVWNPFLHRPSRLSIAHFPDQQRGEFIPQVPSASQQLEELAKGINNIVLQEEKSSE